MIAKASLWLLCRCRLKPNSAMCCMFFSSVSYFTDAVASTLISSSGFRIDWALHYSCHCRIESRARSPQMSINKVPLLAAVPPSSLHQHHQTHFSDHIKLRWNISRVRAASLSTTVPLRPPHYNENLWDVIDAKMLFSVFRFSPFSILDPSLSLSSSPSIKCLFINYDK